MNLRFVCCLLLLLFSVCVLLAQKPRETFVHPPGAFVEVNGAKLWYESEGSGEPLLLIAGGPGNSHLYFHPSFSTLAKRYRVIYFDAYGRGKSDRAKDPAQYSFARDVEDVEGLRKALGLEAMDLLGHSYGGMVAQGYALKYPAHIKRLILSNTLFSGEMWQENNDNYNNEIRNQFPELWDSLMIIRKAGEHSSSPEHQRLYAKVPAGLLYFYDASNSSKVLTDSISFNTKVYYQLVGDDGDFLIGGDVSKLDFRIQLAGLPMPVLIIAGRFDRVAVPMFSVQFQHYAPRATFVMFERSGHQPYVEEPDKYFKTIEDFLAK